VAGAGVIKEDVVDNFLASSLSRIAFNKKLSLK
jgi:hypothetical protein